MKKFVLLSLVVLAWAGSSQAQYTLPFTETFPSYSALPAGWVSWQSNGTGHYWDPTFGMGGTNDGCAFSWYDGTIWLISKSITVPAGGSVDISFYQLDNFPSSYVKHGLYYSTTGAQNLAAWTAINANLGPGDWNWAISPTYTLTGYAGTTIYIAWEYEGSFADGWYVDNFHMEVTNPCVAPTAVNATGITNNSALLGWTAPSPAPSNGYQIYYSTSPTDPTSSTVPTASVGAGITTYSMSSLSANTAYYAWVRSNCGGSSGSWTPVYSFTTLCSAVTVLPFNEGFESGYTDQIPVGPCWTQDGGIYEYYWLANSSQTTFNRGPRTGNWDATLLHYGNSWLFRKFTLTAGMYYAVSCWARQDGSTPTDATIELKYGTVGTPAGMTGDIQSPTGLTTTYSQISGSFTPPTTGDYYIGFHGVINGTPMYITLDDIQVSETYSCFPPTAVAATAIGQTTASIAWTPPASAPASGYDIYYSTSSTPPTISTTPTASVAAGEAAYTMTPLTLGTTYYVWVRSNCGGGYLSMWSTVYSFNTHGILPVVINVPGNYPTLTGVGGAFEAINAGGLNGNTTINITADLTEPGTYALNAWTENPAGSNFTLLIKPDASTLRTISGTLTYTASTPALIRTNGASRFTIDGQAGKYLTFRNTTATPASTAGTVLFDNSSTSCYLKNSTLENNYNSTSYGTVTVGNTGSNSVEISGNDIRNSTAGTIGIPAVGFYCASSTSSLNILNNNVYNCNNYGILMVTAANGAVISGNSVYYNSSTPPTGSQYGIYLMAATFNHLVSNNYVGGQAPLCQGNAWTYPGMTWAGIYSAGTNAGAITFSGNIIRNITMTSSSYSSFYGLKTSDGLFNIMNNTVGSESVAGSITYAGTGYFYGLYLISSNEGNQVDNNIFGNWSLTAASGTPLVCGIYVSSMNASKNKIFNISVANAALTADIRGILCQSIGTGTNVYSNNLISLDGGAGIHSYIAGFSNGGNYSGMNFKFYYNDIHISGPTSLGSSIAFNFWTYNNLELKNNIFSNLRGQVGANNFVLYFLNHGALISDHNDFYTVTGPFSYYGGSNQGSLAAWKTVTGQDANSLSTDPLFVSSVDLHPQQPLLVAGTPVTGITTDYAGITRATVPTIGAYEMPQVTTTAATSVTQTAAVLNGSVNACSQNVVTSFEYGLTTAYGSSVTAIPSPVTGTTSTGISASLAGLTINTLYHYRAVGTVGTLKYYGADFTFDLVPTPSITSGPTVVCSGVPGNVYTTQSGKSNYDWTVVGGTVTAGGTSASNTVTVTWNTTGTQSVSVNYQNSNGIPGPTPAVYNVTVNPASVGGSINPAAATIIIGSSTGTLTLTGYTGAIQKWQRRFNGGSYTDIANTLPTYSETPGAVGVYDYRVEVMNGTCNAAYSALSTVTVNNFTLVPGNVSSNASVCSGSAAPTLTSTPPNGTSPTYQWQSSTDNVVFNNISGQLGATYSPGALTTTTYFRQIQNSTGTNGGPLPTNSVTITVNPLPVPTIQGPASTCFNSGYCNYITEPNMQNYVWTVSPGGNITYGSGTNQIQVSWIGAGAQTVSVTYTNASGCNAASPAVFNVTVNPLPDPAGSVTGNANVCKGANGVAYSVAPVPNATVYVWTLPNGATIASGAGTNSITVNFDPYAASGVIFVYGNNSCGNGLISPVFSVTVGTLPGAAGTISGSHSVCAASSGIAYSVATIPGATGYNWTVPSGATIVSGANTNNITVDFDATAVAGAITVSGTNTCGNGAVSPDLNITVAPIPEVPVISTDGVTLTSSATAGNQWYFNDAPITGATNQTFVPVLDGWYYVVTTVSGCSAQSDSISFFVGIDDPVSSVFRIYPVPNEGKFTVSMISASRENFTITVFNNLGLRICEIRDVQMNGRSDHIVDLRPVDPGIYMVVVRISEQQIIRKIIVGK